MTDKQTTEAHAWLGSQRTAMVNDLVELANQNSGSNNLPGLERVAQWLEDWMTVCRMKCQTVHLPPRHTINDRGDEIALQSGCLLQWDQRLEAQRRVLLGIHYDTVYSAEHPLQSCVRQSSDRLAGPGVADAKGGIVVLRYAVQALETFELARECGWTVYLNPDEEIGSPSSAAHLVGLAPNYDFGLLFEPAFPNGSLVSQRKGSGSFTLVMHGRSAHAGRDFERGRNAVAHLARLVASIDGLNGARSDVTINVGQLIGGGPVNVVPDLAIARVNARVADAESQRWFENELRTLVAEANRREGWSCRLQGGFHAPPKMFTQSLHQLMQAVEYSAQKLEQPIAWTATGGVSDGNRLAGAGLPNVDTMGPIGDCLHSHDEWVSIDSLVEKASLLVELLAGYSAGLFESLQRQSRNV